MLETTQADKVLRKRVSAITNCCLRAEKGVFNHFLIVKTRFSKTLSAWVTTLSRRGSTTDSPQKIDINIEEKHSYHSKYEQYNK